MNTSGDFFKVLGVDATPLEKISGGIGFSLFYLLEELVQIRKDVLFVLYTFSDQGDFDYFKKFKNVIIRPVKKMAQYHGIWTQTGLAYQIWNDKIDYFWGPAQFIPLIKRKNLRCIITIHDFVFLLCPSSMSTMKHLLMRTLSGVFFKNAQIRLCVSKGTANKLLSFYGLSHGAITYPPLKKTIAFKSLEESKSFLEKANLCHKGFILTVGSIEPRKNLIQLLDFYEKALKKEERDKILPLVIVGGGGWKNKDILQKLDQMKKDYPDHVYVMGFVSDEEISYYYSSARYFILFSTYEGYGMPLAESRMCKTPVICFSSEEMREASEGDGIFLPRKDFDSELLFYFKKDYQTKEVKNCSYPSNYETAEIIAKMIL